jgi:hypothetical protein
MFLGIFLVFFLAGMAVLPPSEGSDSIQVCGCSTSRGASFTSWEIVSVQAGAKASRLERTAPAKQNR